jgi:hypothetical protein
MGMAGALTGALALDIGNDTETAGEAMAQERQAAAATLKQSWERIGQRLRAELGEDLYSSWFARMEAERLDAGKLVASVPTRFLRNWIEAHYADRLRRICEVELGPLDSVSIRVRVCGGMPARIAEPARRSAPEEPGQLAARALAAPPPRPPAPSGHRQGPRLAARPWPHLRDLRGRALQRTRLQRREARGRRQAGPAR